ncbi:MAG: GNAT family N-acetyltransferase [Candidatus Pristimantibacillus lignocellulolyticus]|uniref:GNAT family N-acetyltransferase n=1 Tax=Candidatus Pristimantibacillus lignocellulolyticus TaxID=2994561 RepID=A0A9J6ZCG4_9BACL|nr:MAG: GNAT family N-acetyltransferase [Candidatus Pristimantibacillus lignocellulolyticus]
MIIKSKDLEVKGLKYSIRSAVIEDAETLSKLRVQIDGETENMDRERGEAYIDTSAFEEIIKTDTESLRNLFLVAVIDTQIVGYSRCEGTNLKRLLHKVEFGVCVLKEYWGYRIGKNLLQESISWADSVNIKKMTLNVLETNNKAIELYKNHGFEIEGILKMDKLLADEIYYNTIVMGRLKSEIW